MPTSLEDLERRVVILEARMHANDLEHASVQEKLNTLVGGQDAMLGMLRDQGRLLATHDARLDRIDGRLDGIDGKLDIVLAWIATQP